MSMFSRIILGAFVVLLAAVSGCGNSGTTPMNTRAIEEKYLGMGDSVRMYEYGETLLADGRYREAYAAFLSAEQNAYTTTLRDAARKRRLWLGESIQAMEAGGPPLQPGAVELGVEQPEPPRPVAATADSSSRLPDAGMQVLPGIGPGAAPIIIPGPPQ